ncbi:hypothetical protein [Streptomyces tsukubensis]|uniref:hypothetical protein n=1 Tax=Streptomyces tsukubensis TaxID=83656 RepID=UPI00344FEB53
MPEPGREGRATPCEKHDIQKDEKGGEEGTGRAAPNQNPDKNTAENTAGNTAENTAGKTDENTAARPGTTESEEARRRRRAAFLRELNEAKALRDRVRPRRARAARMRQQMRMRTFRW